ncbi:MAG TPA: hypothetical protein VLB73_00355 [Patescibacteria group bacterium]|nr:hypothetical protein [Patescibacteria group bacterium]
MNNKWLWAIVGILILFLVGAFAYYKLALKSSAPTTVGEKPTSVVASIQDALAKNMSLQCQFSSDDGIATVAYIKSGSIRANTSVGTANETNMIMKDKKIYFWKTNEKTGTLMALPSITLTPVPQTTKATSSSEQSSDSSNVLSMLEKFKDACKVASIADSLFVPPASVTFRDMSDMMKQTMPSGAPTGMSQQDIQKMMQQYATPTGY